MRLIPSCSGSARQGAGPLLCFGLFDGFETPDLSTLLPSADGAFVAVPAPRQPAPDYERSVERVREHLFAGDFYQANLTFGCDVAVAGDPLALYARLRRSSRAGWGGVLSYDGVAHHLAVTRAILHHPRRRHRSPADEGHRAARRRTSTPIALKRNCLQPTKSSVPKI